MHENEQTIGNHLIFILKRYARCLEFSNVSHVNLYVPNSISDSVKFLSQRIKESITVFKFTEVFFCLFVCLFCLCSPVKLWQVAQTSSTTYRD